MTSSDEGVAAVREMVARHAGLSAGDVADGVALAELGVGSFALMRILADVQEHFGVELSADDVVASMDADVAGLHRLALLARDRAAGT
jgi:acyl carrier protein